MFKTKKPNEKKKQKKQKEQKNDKNEKICITNLEEASSIETFTDICATQRNLYK